MQITTTAKTLNDVMSDKTEFSTDDELLGFMIGFFKFPSVSKKEVKDAEKQLKDFLFEKTGNKYDVV